MLFVHREPKSYKVSMLCICHIYRRVDNKATLKLELEWSVFWKSSAKVLWIDGSCVFQQDMSDSDEEKSDSTDSDEDDETSGSTDSDDDDDEVTR